MARRLGTLALSLYCLLLIVAGWPQYFTPKALAFMKEGSQDILDLVSIEPGLRLFYRPYDEPMKMRNRCIEFQFYDANNVRVHKEFSGEGCTSPRAFVWSADLRAMILHRFFEEAGMIRLHQKSLHGDIALQSDDYRMIREASLQSVVGNYFCHSQEHKQWGATRLVVGWHQDLLNYATGAHDHQLFSILDWNCIENKINGSYYEPHFPQEILDEFFKD